MSNSKRREHPSVRQAPRSDVPLQQQRQSQYNASGYGVDLNEQEEDEGLYPTRTRSSVIRYRPLETREEEQPFSSAQALTTRGRHDLQCYDADVNIYVHRRASAPPATRERGRPPATLSRQAAERADEEEEEEDQQLDTEPLEQSAGRHRISQQPHR